MFRKEDEREKCKNQSNHKGRTNLVASVGPSIRSRSRVFCLNNKRMNITSKGKKVMDCARGETVDDIKEGSRRRKVFLEDCECGGPKFVEVLGNIRGVAGVGGG